MCIVNFDQLLNMKKNLLKGVGAEHQETLSVPLHRYSAPAVDCSLRSRPREAGDRGGHHGMAVLHLSKEKKTPNLGVGKRQSQKKGPPQSPLKGEVLRVPIFITNLSIIMSKNKKFFRKWKKSRNNLAHLRKMAIFAPVKRPSDHHKNGKICNEL